MSPAARKPGSALDGATRLRAAAYLRVSNVKQTEMATIKTQEYALDRFMEKHPEWELVGIYVDDGFTAKTGAEHLAKREDFTRYRKAYERGEFEVAIVYSIDRLSRSELRTERNGIIGMFDIIAELASGAVLDQRTIGGEVMVFLGGLLASQDNAKRAQRAADGFRRVRLEGKWAGGPVPYGLAYDKKTGWRIVEAEAAIVRELYERVAAGESAPSVGRDFDRRGFLAPGHKQKRRSDRKNAKKIMTGGSWSYAAVQLIHRATYRGELATTRPHDPTRVSPPIMVPAIVSPELWARAVASLAKHGKRGLDKTQYDYLMLGVAKCGQCGSRIHCRSPQADARRPNRKTLPARYYCSAQKDRHGTAAKKCTMPRVNVADVDGKVWAVLCEMIHDPEVLARHLDLNGAASETRAAWAADLVKWKAKLAKLDAGATNMADLVAQDLIPAKQAAASLAKLKRERELLQSQIETAAVSSTSLETARASLGEILAELDLPRSRGELASVSMAIRRKTLAALVRGAILRADGTIDLGVAWAITPRNEAGIPRALVSSVACPTTHESPRDNASDSVRFRLIA